MDLSLFLARALGLMYLLVGIGMFVSPEHYKRLYKDSMTNTTLLYMGGFMAFLIGFSVVTFHNLWVKDWRSIVTIIGWMALIKGCLLLASPQTIMRYAKYWEKRMQVAKILVFALGLILGYYGFFA